MINVGYFLSRITNFDPLPLKAMSDDAADLSACLHNQLLSMTPRSRRREVLPTQFHHEIGALDVVLTLTVSATADEFFSASGYLFMAEQTDLAVATKIWVQRDRYQVSSSSTYGSFD